MVGCVSLFEVLVESSAEVVVMVISILDDVM